MKYITLVVLSIILSSCGSTTTTIDSVSHQKVKVYNGEEYSFQYPKTWRTFIKNESDKKSVVRIAPTDLIFSEYISTGYNSRGMKTYSIVYENSKTQICIAKDSINGDLNTYINKYLETLERANTTNTAMLIQSIITKESPTHFIEEKHIKRKIRNAYSTFQINTTHYYLHNNQVYNISYTTTPIMSYKKDADLVFRSFRFISNKATE